MAGNPLAGKLQIKPRNRLLVLNAPPGYLARLGPLPNGVGLAERPSGTYDVVHLFVNDKAELGRLAQRALESIRPRGVFWVSYPKRSAKVSTDITRDVGSDQLMAAGWRPVSQVSIDDVWSALRFRPVADVGR